MNNNRLILVVLQCLVLFSVVHLESQTLSNTPVPASQTTKEATLIVNGTEIKGKLLTVDSRIEHT